MAATSPGGLRAATATVMSAPTELPIATQRDAST